MGSSLAEANSGVEKSTYQRNPMAAISANELSTINTISPQELLSSLSPIAFEGSAGQMGQFNVGGASSMAGVLAGVDGNGIVNGNALSMSTMGAPNANESYMWVQGRSSSPLATRAIDGGTRFHYLNGYVDSYGDQGFNETFGNLDTGVKLRAGAFDALKDRLSLDGISSDERGLISDYLARRENAIGSGNFRAMRAAYESFADEGLLANYRNQETMMAYGRVLDPSNPWNKLVDPSKVAGKFVLENAASGGVFAIGSIALKTLPTWRTFLTGGLIGGGANVSVQMATAETNEKIKLGEVTNAIVTGGLTFGRGQLFSAAVNGSGAYVTAKLQGDDVVTKVAAATVGSYFGGVVGDRGSLLIRNLAVSSAIRYDNQVLSSTLVNTYQPVKNIAPAYVSEYTGVAFDNLPSTKK